MNYFANIRKNWLSIALLIIVALALSVILSYVQTPEYRSTFSLLVIEKEPNLDAFAAAKSAERLSTSLGQIIYTTSFYDKVINSGYLPSSIKFPSDEQERRSEWKRRINIQVLPEVGILRFSVFDRDRAQAENLATALAMVLSEDGTEYLGGGKSIVLKVVDYPITSNQPVRPSIPLNLVAGGLFGLVASIGYFAFQARRLKKQVSQPDQEQTEEASVQTPDIEVEQPALLENNYMFQEYYPKTRNLESIEDIVHEPIKQVEPQTQKTDKSNSRIRTFYDHAKGLPGWNGPEEELQDFE